MANLLRHWLLAFACIGLTGCASIGPPLPPSLELPRPPVDLHASRKGDKVTLTWTVPRRTTDRRSIRFLGQTQICRGLEPVLKECGKPAAEVPPPPNFEGNKKSPGKKLTATFVDTLPTTLEQEHPQGFATYAIEVLNTAGRGIGLSNQVHVALLPTLPPFADFRAKVTAQGVRITWQCVKPPAVLSGMKYLFRIYRHLEAGGPETRIAEIDDTSCATGSTNAGAESDNIVSSFLDQTFEWEKTYLYRGAVVSVMPVPGKSPVEVEGDDTSEVKVLAHDVFPPAVPTGLQAVFSGPGQAPFIDLSWPPVTDADLAGYNVYRHEGGGPPVKLNSELVKAPAFRDTQVNSGQTYFYSVAAVDQRSNESARSEEAGERVP
jgi:hypothetical protein